jgi:hypothetical protein
MITRSRQDWTPGAVVKVGFLTLEVVECIPTPGDYRPAPPNPLPSPNPQGGPRRPPFFVRTLAKP